MEPPEDDPPTSDKPISNSASSSAAKSPTILADGRIPGSLHVSELDPLVDESLLTMYFTVPESTLHGGKTAINSYSFLQLFLGF